MKWFALAVVLMLVGCGSQEIHPAHKGRMFEKTGVLAFYAGGKGFNGPVLGPGTYYTGVYPEIRMLECAQKTVKEPMTALTKDGVQFSLDMYISYGANCDEEVSVNAILEKVTPELATPPNVDTEDSRRTITAAQLYGLYVRPALGEAVREAVSPYIANDVNSSREEIFGKIKVLFEQSLAKQKPRLVAVYGTNLSNLDFPDAMDKANAERAAQAILKDKSIAERAKVEAETDTAKLDIIKQKTQAQAEAAWIDEVGAALHRNPEFYVRDIYRAAADKGGSMMVPTDPKVILQLTPKR